VAFLFICILIDFMAKKRLSAASRPLGIFDSGIGGLTVANAIRHHLPGESLIYFGDTAHLPYGDKSPEAIRSYAIRICDFLMESNVKMVVIACNTASSVAYEAVKKHLHKKALLVNVIDPVVKAVTEAKHRRIGVIGTKATVKSDVYAKKLLAKNKKLEVASLATPLLAPMIEEGYFNNRISSTIIASYLSRPKIKKIDSLILACTHYPLIKPEIEKYYKKKVNIVDSADIVGRYVKDTLSRNNLLNKTGKASHHFYVSDYTRSFEKSTRIFFKGKVRLSKKNLWT
jgi:glutamate racemase